ncbi:hypothetical protein [Vibrio splendidus]|uniref:hypothetical protein n=1 Tax=Vibrio splendidus TaxID=29497 RepID=UPI0021B2ACDE|nr:hypothetical protein [Vibrio splendidus]UWZ98828.1 hypothetical protein IM698_05600 [Vibrio splendidus]
MSGIHVSKVERESFLLVLMIARLSTAAFRQINEAYDIEFSKALSKHLYGQNRRLREELSYFVKNVQKQILEQKVIESASQDWIRDGYVSDQANAVEFGYQMFSRPCARYAIV